MVEASIRSLCFTPDIATSILENGIIDEEMTQRRHDNSEIQSSSDSEMLVDSL